VERDLRGYLKCGILARIYQEQIQENLKRLEFLLRREVADSY
jgi:hypothetical protein